VIAGPAGVWRMTERAPGVIYLGPLGPKASFFAQLILTADLQDTPLAAKIQRKRR
jgi:hypothetical protein